MTTPLIRLRKTPAIDARYWVAILIASMCGTNFGDIFPDVLKLSSVAGLGILVLLFVAVVLADRLSARGSEAYYWLAILVVRAGATNIADFSIARLHLGFGTAIVPAALFLAAIIVAGPRSSNKIASGSPPTTGVYWLTMLSAGVLGTLIGDGLGHAFGSVETGWPISAALATVTLVVLLPGGWWKLKSRSVASYWICVVAVRWWGTNAGDILGFLLSKVGSMLATGLVLAATLSIWRRMRSTVPS